MSYRSYITVHGDDGKRLGKVGLEPIVANLNAHVREADEQGFQIGFNAARVATHMGQPVIRLELDTAWQVRLAWRVSRRWLTLSGLHYWPDHTAAFRKAL